MSIRTYIIGLVQEVLETTVRPALNDLRHEVLKDSQERLIRDKKAMEDRFNEERQELYRERNTVIALASSLAKAAGIETGIGHDPSEPEWPVVFIELPTGQVSWHVSRSERKFLLSNVKAHTRVWDGHSTNEKYSRIREFMDGSSK